MVRVCLQRQQDIKESMMRISTRFIALLLTVVFASTLMGCGTSVPPGCKGIYYNWRTGTDVEKTYNEGFEFVAPWNDLIVYDVRVTDQKEALKILCLDQLNLSMDMSVRYRPDPENIGLLHTKIGPDFYEKIIAPVLRNITRDTVAKYESMEAYLNRDSIESTIMESVVESLKDRPFIIEAVMLRNIDFPKKVTDAIEAKLAMKQEAEKMKYVLQKEELEAQRKSVEAKGIADFQRIVSQGINENLLRWKGIEATMALAESPNSKVVVIGSGKDGLPLILGK